MGHFIHFSYTPRQLVWVKKEETKKKTMYFYMYFTNDIYVNTTLNLEEDWILEGRSPVSIKHLYNMCMTLAQRFRRCPNIGQMLYKYFVFAGRVGPHGHGPACPLSCSGLWMAHCIMYSTARRPRPPPTGIHRELFKEAILGGPLASPICRQPALALHPKSDAQEKRPACFGGGEAG